MTPLCRSCRPRCIRHPNQVAWLDVPVNNAVVAQMLKALRSLRYKGRRFREREYAAGLVAGQVGPVCKVLHRQVRAWALGVGGHEPHHVRVVGQLAKRPDLAAEALDDHRAASELRPHLLQRDLAAVRPDGSKNLAHPPTVDQPDQGERPGIPRQGFRFVVFGFVLGFVFRVDHWGPAGYLCMWPGRRVRAWGRKDRLVGVWGWHSSPRSQSHRAVTANRNHSRPCRGPSSQMCAESTIAHRPVSPDQCGERRVGAWAGQGGNEAPGGCLGLRQPTGRAARETLPMTVPGGDPRKGLVSGAA